MQRANATYVLGLIAVVREWATGVAYNLTQIYDAKLSANRDKGKTTSPTPM